MKKLSQRWKGPDRQGGYALLLVVFMTMLLTLSTIVAAPSTRTERQREKEEEMIWRGKQYIRGIKLYYRKNGRFPTSLDDLTKPKTGSLRYLREAYKDPTNKEDGTWRLIYVGPAGQLIGSLKPPQTLQLAGAAGAQPGTPASALGGFGNQQGASAAQAVPSATGAQPGGTTPGNAQNNGAGAGDNGSTTPATSLASTDSLTTVMGGNIIGVGSKIDKRSIIMYEKAKNYRLFEFIWDPSKDVMAIGGQAGTQIGTPNAPGQGLGQGPGQGFGGQGTFGSQPAGNPMPQPTTPPLTPNNPPQP